MGSWFDYTVNGLVIGNIYALLAIGLALIFGVANLINFAQGSVFTVGAYIGWTAIRYLHTPLPVTVAIVAVGSGALGAAIERFALRPLHQRSRIAVLLATIGVGLVLDQTLQLIFSAEPRAMPSQLPDWRLPLGGVTIGAIDLLIAGFGVTAAALLFGFLRFSKLGWAVRATAQDPDAARQMGVDIDRVNVAVFGIASALGGVGGLLVGMFYHSIDITMSFDDPQGHGGDADRGPWQRAGSHRGRADPRTFRELRRRPVRHELPQPVRLRPHDRDPGRCAERPVQLAPDLPPNR